MARQSDKDQKDVKEGTSRIKSHTTPAKSRGAAVGSISRKAPVVPTAHPAGTPVRKSASINVGKRLPQPPPTGKR